MSYKSNAYGVDMDQLKHNFKQYQYKGAPSIQTSQNKQDQPNAANNYKSNYQANISKYLTPPSNTTKITNNSTDNAVQQNTGNKGDWTTTIGDQNSFNNSNIGNDYSVNIGGVGIGEGGGSSSALNNMQGLAAYQALNNNQHQRSKSELSGSGRSQQAINDGKTATGAYDRAANLYNSMGYSQNYWRQKSDAQQNFYLGDIFKMNAPEHKGGGVKPSDPMAGDKTKEIYDDFRDSIGS